MDPFAPCPPHPQQALMCFTLLPKNSRAWAEVVYEEEKVAVPTEGLIFAPRSGCLALLLSASPHLHQLALRSCLAQSQHPPPPL